MAMNPGLIGGIVGGLMGVIGGLIGTYYGVKNTNGPRERRFMIGAAVVMWVGVGAFVVLLFVLPPKVRPFLWIPYSILLPIGIVVTNRRQAAIRRQERQTRR
jgi:hypothetical protein